MREDAVGATETALRRHQRGLAQVAERDARTRVQEGPGDAETDAGAGARDEDHLILEVEHCPFVARVSPA
jgi:hypothetical protein